MIVSAFSRFNPNLTVTDKAEDTLTPPFMQVAHECFATSCVDVGT